MRGRRARSTLQGWRYTGAWPADELAAASPTDLEVVEARVVALRRLGRDSDAEEAERRLVVASGGRSDLRVRP